MIMSFIHSQDCKLDESEIVQFKKLHAVCKPIRITVQNLEKLLKKLEPSHSFSAQNINNVSDIGSWVLTHNHFSDLKRVCNSLISAIKLLERYFVLLIANAKYDKDSLMKFVADKLGDLKNEDNMDVFLALDRLRRYNHFFDGPDRDIMNKYKSS